MRLTNYALIAAALVLAGCGGAAARDGAAGASTQASAPAAAAAAPPGANSAAPPGTNSASRGTNSAAGARTLLFVGTSLTAGYGLDPDSAYPQMIQQKIDAAGLSYQVVNAGVSGETSSSLLRRMDWLLRQPFAVIVIETGANDGLRGVPIETMRENIQRIIDRVKETRPEARIVLAQMEAPPNLGISYTRRFRTVFPELARKNDVALLPFLLDGVAGHRDLNQADGIHPNLEGERIVAENVWKGLRPLLN